MEGEGGDAERIHAYAMKIWREVKEAGGESELGRVVAPTVHSVNWVIEVGSWLVEDQC